MGFFEVSPLVNFNISESFAELARMAWQRNGMERLWRSNKGGWGREEVNRTTVYGVDRLPLPESVRQNLKSYSLTSYSTLRRPQGMTTPSGRGRHSASSAGSVGGIIGGSRLYKSLKQRRRSNRHSLPAQPSSSSDGSGLRCGGGGGGGGAGADSRKSCLIS